MWPLSANFHQRQGESLKLLLLVRKSRHLEIQTSRCLTASWSEIFKLPMDQWVWMLRDDECCMRRLRKRSHLIMKGTPWAVLSASSLSDHKTPRSSASFETIRWGRGWREETSPTYWGKHRCNSLKKTTRRKGIEDGPSQLGEHMLSSLKINLLEFPTPRTWG